MDKLEGQERETERSSTQEIEMQMEEVKNNGNVVKQRRASRPKVKTGCSNCKIRRVKCDEARPQCLKCVKSGRPCEGYPAHKRTVDFAIPIAPRPELEPRASVLAASPASAAPQKQHHLARPPRMPRKKTAIVLNSAVQHHPPQQTPQLPSPTVYRPGGLIFDAQESQYFQVFRTHTASELSGFFDSEFWQRSVLQESHSEASIRHAVVALGALYKTLETAAESPPGSPDNGTFDTAPSHYSFALQQYGKALKRLRESLANNEKRSDRTTLISIVLFTCFQSFTGDHRAAIKQIQYGLGLLEERRQNSDQPLIRRKEEIVEDELVQIFTRLAVQAKSYDMAFHFPHPYVIRLSPQTPPSPASTQMPSFNASSSSDPTPTIPPAFQHTHEARAALHALCERIMRFNEHLSSLHRGPNNILPKSVMVQGHGFGTQLKQWDSAFAHLLAGRRHRGVSNTERAGINVIKMLQLMTGILYQMAFSTSEMEFDAFTPQFREIVELASELVLDEELALAQARCGKAASCRHTLAGAGGGYRFPGLAGGYGEDGYAHIKASFALDLGIVPPLFVVATKCRDRRLRREAIRLLMSSPRREGMWDSILCGMAGQWIMTIEERELSQWSREMLGRKGDEIVPDQQRVMVKEILFDMQSREATLRCGTRGAREGDLDVRAKETHISW
ncbi:transcription factor Cys [Marssonina coronariae]|uniref:Transcription factor Cys n=1 Tax=Diplocarpon coronariae TaxID=2795749 RepID=A0A218YTV7_9HELO|nr:transcription factor Cys [Marssonina coronariae]